MLKSSKGAKTPLRNPPPRTRFFASAPAFRTWLARHHQTRSELWVGFHRKGTGKAGLEYSDAVDIALCFGWIDGIRKKLDATTYTNRFTPRKPGSIWSRINIARVERLITAGLMEPAGLAAFARRTDARSGLYSFEQRPEAFPAELEQRFRRHRRAWSHFSAEPPGYRRLAIWWVSSAKREETRLARLDRLVDASALGHRLGVLYGQTGTVATPARRTRP